MSVHEKEARPGRCYCRGRNEAASLNDIAKIIAALNHKILGLRNEVNAFKNVDDEKKSLVGKKAPGHLLAVCYETEPDTQPGGPMISGPAVTHVVPFQANSIVNCKFKRERIDGVDVLAGIFRDRINGNAYPNLVTKRFPRTRRKKISRSVQCDLTMGRRIRDFFNCFKIPSIIEENTLWKRSKEVRRCRKNNNRVSFDPDLEEIFGSVKQEDPEDLQMDFKEDLDRTIDWTLESVDIQQIKETGTINRLKGMQENKIVEIDADKGKTMDDNDEDSDFEYSIASRMSGGAEFRGNRFISDFGDKIQKICLYKNVKFDAKNVKRRLDACIAELNEIIEDIILIFPDQNACNA